jgi:hypothetical protein
MVDTIDRAERTMIRLWRDAKPKNLLQSGNAEAQKVDDIKEPCSAVDLVASVSPSKIAPVSKVLIR